MKEQYKFPSEEDYISWMRHYGDKTFMEAQAEYRILKNIFDRIRILEIKTSHIGE